MKLNKWLATSYLLVMVVLLVVYSVHYIQGFKKLEPVEVKGVDVVGVPIAGTFVPEQDENYVCSYYTDCKVATPSATPVVKGSALPTAGL